MALSITTLSAYESWTRVTSGYSTAEALDAVETEIDCTNFPAGVYAIGDWIQIEAEYMQISGVDDVNNKLTVTRADPVTHATAKVIFFAGIGAQSGDILVGDHISNTSRAGEGTIVHIVNDSFGTDSGVRTLKYLVLSGSFVAGDAINCVRGGSFTLGKTTATSTTEDTILVNGTMSDTDSTYNTNEALDATEQEITVTATTNLSYGQIIRIDDTVDEYCYIIQVINATTIKVARGLFDTGGTHDTNKDIYIVNTNLFEQILDADVSGVWGFSDTSNGRIQLDCHLMLGRTDNTAKAILISSAENVDLTETATNMLWGMGNDTYRTHCSFGKGYMDEGTQVFTGIAISGSILNAKDCYTYPGCTMYFYDSSLNIDLLGALGAVIAKNWSITPVSGTQYNNLFQATGEESKLYNTFYNHTAINFGSGVVDIANMFSYAAGADAAVYFIYSLGDATIWNFETNEDYSTTGGFIAGGTKTFINCKCATSSDVFWGVHVTVSKKTFDCNVKDPLGNAIEGATVKCNYRIDSTDNIFSVATDANGDIAQQQVQFRTYESNVGGEETRNIEYFVYKGGYKKLSGRIYIEDRDEPIELYLTLEPLRYVEERSI